MNWRTMRVIGAIILIVAAGFLLFRATTSRYLESGGAKKYFGRTPPAFQHADDTLVFRASGLRKFKSSGFVIFSPSAKEPSEPRVFADGVKLEGKTVQVNSNGGEYDGKSQFNFSLPQSCKKLEISASNPNIAVIRVSAMQTNLLGIAGLILLFVGVFFLLYPFLSVMAKNFIRAAQPQIRFGEKLFAMLSDKMQSPSARWFYLVIPLATFAVFAGHSIGNPNLWFDESAQFWIAKGLNPFSAALSPVGGVREVIINNGSYNLDPGGFSLLLHFWTMISNELWFIRLLPLAFWILSAWLAVKIAEFYLPKRSGVASVKYLCGLIFFFAPNLCGFAFELRAYSMEMFAAMLALYLAIPRQRKMLFADTRRALLFSALLALATTSRYAAFVAIMPLNLLLAVDFLRQRARGKNWRKPLISLIIFAAPQIIIAVSVYYFSLRVQNTSSPAATYVHDVILRYQTAEQILEWLWREKFVWLPTAALLFAIIRFYSRIPRYRDLAIFISLENVLFIALSLAGKYPYTIGCRWNVSVNALMSAALIPLFAIFRRRYPRLSSPIIGAVMALAVVGGITFRFTSWDYFADEYRAEIGDRSAAIITNYTALPTVKYLFEHGCLRDYAQNYPQNFAYYGNNGSEIFNYRERKKIGENSADTSRYDYLFLSHFSVDEIPSYWQSWEKSRRGISWRNPQRVPQIKALAPRE